MNQHAAAFEDRGVCLIATPENAALLVAAYSCADAFTNARNCNARNEPAANNSQCGTECAADEFALGGKCLALKLNAGGDMLEHAPSGRADAINAGSRMVVVGMTETGLLGTTRLEVGAEISKIQLPASRFGIPAPDPATVTVAAGAGAIGEEVARIGLTILDEAIGAMVSSPTAPANLSLIVLPSSTNVQTVVYYLDSALGGGTDDDTVILLTVESLNGNYLPLPQSVTLNITAAADVILPAVDGKAGVSNPYVNEEVENFRRAGVYPGATEFERDADASDDELALNANTGIVSTSEPITAPGTYRLVVSVTSPDFIGKARLEFNLVLGAEDSFASADTIPLTERNKDVFVVPGYSGSVAFFDAVSVGVTLRTPSSAPSGFSLGDGGLDADFIDGFTVFLEPNEVDNGGDTAVATLAVTAREAGFADLAIDLTVSVAAVRPAAQADLTASIESANYGGVDLPAGFQADGNNPNPFEIVGAGRFVSDGAGGGDYADSLADADYNSRVGILGTELSPIDQTDPNQRLESGRYRITMAAIHSGFLGTLTVEVLLNVQETLDENDIVPAAARDVTVTVATGYSGDGHTVALDAVNYEFVTVLFESGAADYDEARNVITLNTGVTAELNLAVTATANCAESTGRNCAPLALTVSAAFIPLEAIGQNELVATEGRDFPAHTVETGAYAGADLVIVGAEGPADNVFELDGSGAAIARVAGSDLRNGRYTITVAMRHAGFLGALTLEVTARIQEALAADSVVSEEDRNVTVTVATGYSGEGYQVPVDVSEYRVLEVSLDAAKSDYDRGGNRIDILPSAAVAADLALTATLIVDCATRDCAPLTLEVKALFVPLPPFGQSELNADYSDDFAHAVAIGGYDLNARANLTIAGITRDGDAVDNDAFLLIDGELARNATDNTPEAGVYTVTLELTHEDKGIGGGFLGTLTLEVTANISRKALDAAGLNLPAPAAGVVKIAAGAGAVGEEIGRAALTGGDAGIGASIQEQTVFPENLSLEFLPAGESQTVVFYLDSALDGGGVSSGAAISVERTTELTITSTNLNYLPLPQTLTLTIRSLERPGAAVVNGEATPGNPYTARTNIYDFKNFGTAGDYTGATSFVKIAAESSAELLVDAASGIVSTAVDITQDGTYNLAVSVTSPDFAGAARLELRLILTPEDVFATEDTIPVNERVQNIAVVPGYSGEVASYGARSASITITLRTPSAAPDGFSLTVDTDYAPPNEFELLLNAGAVPNAGDATVAVFTVTAKAAGFVDTAIELTASVAALTPPTQAELTAGHEDASYGDAVLPSGFQINIDNANPFAIIGVADTSGDVADWATRVKIEGAALKPFAEGNENQRLAPGQYEITVETTHSGFKGTLTAAVSLDVQRTLKPDDVVAVREATQPAVEGYFGASGDAGYAITIGSGYELAYSYDDSAVTVDEASNQIKAASALTAELLATVAADVTCVPADNCAPLTITLSVTFTPVGSPAQNKLNSNPKKAYDHSLNAPAGYAFTAGNTALSVASVSLLVDGTATEVPAEDGVDRVAIDANTYELDSVGVGLEAGEYLIAVDMTHPGFLGTLTLTVEANIETEVALSNVLKEENRRVTQQVAPGYDGSDGRIITIDSDYILANLDYDTDDFLVEADTGKGEYEVGLVNAMGNSALVAAVTADVECASLVNCEARKITLSVTFTPVAAEAQEILTVGDDDGEPYNHNVVLAAAHSSAALRIAGAHNTDSDTAVSDFVSRITIESGKLQRVGDGAGQRLAFGSYEITVEATTADTSAGFLGTLSLVIEARIRNSVNPDNVLADRDLTVRVAAGHPGLAALKLGEDNEYRVPAVSADYRLDNAALVDNTGFSFNSDTFVVRLSNAMPSDMTLTMVMTAAVICTTNGSNCAPRQLTVSVAFAPVTDPGQILLASNEDQDYDHAVVLPAGFTDGATVTVVNLSDRVTVTEDSGQHKLNPVDNSVADQRLPSGPSQKIALRVTHSDFAGILQITVTANIAGGLSPDAVVRDREPIAYVADGWFGNASAEDGYVIVVETGHRLKDVVLEAESVNTVDAVYAVDAGNSREIRLSTRFFHPETLGSLDSDDSRKVVVKAGVECVTPGGQIDSDRNCAALTITMTIDFKVLKNPAQNNVTVSEDDSFYDHLIVIPAELDRDGASYEISRVTREGVVIQNARINTDPANQLVLIDSQGRLQPRNLGFTAEDADGTWYDVTPVFSHSNLVGKFQNIAPIRVYVGEPVDANAALAEADRDVTLNVAEGHFGDAGDAGYRIPFGRLNNVTFSVDFDGAGSPNFEVVEDSGAYEVRLDGALAAGGAGVRALTLTATASCTPGGDRICSDPATLTLTLTFKRRANPTFYASIMEEFNSNRNFEVAVSIPDEYSIHTTPGILNRTVSVIGRLDYPLPLTGAVAGTAGSCLALGGRVVTDGAAQICVDYTFSNSEERTATGGGCVISGGPSGELECSEAFEQVRDCNTGGVRRPAMNNSACSATSQGICPGGYALGGGCPIVGALTFRESDEMLVYAAGDEISAPGAGVYTVTIALTHPSLLGRLIAGAIVSITKKDAPGNFGLDGGTSATRRIAHGYTGEVYRTSAAGGVITLPATLPSDIYSATGGRELVINLTQALPLRGSPTHMFTLTVKYSNVNRAKNYNGKEQVLALLVESLGNPIPQIRPVSSNEHPAGSHVYDFSTDYESGAYADATFSEIGDSPHFEVSAGGVVETQAALAPGEYAITIEAQDPRGTSEAFIGAATLTLSLTIVADGGRERI